MITSYRLAYITGRYVIKVAKFYFAGKFIRATHTHSKTVKIAENDKIDSNSPEIVTKNIFDCLKYLD